MFQGRRRLTQRPRSDRSAGRPSRSAAPSTSGMASSRSSSGTSQQATRSSNAARASALGASGSRQLERDGGALTHDATPTLAAAADQMKAGEVGLDTGARGEAGAWGRDPEGLLGVAGAGPEGQQGLLGGGGEGVMDQLGSGLLDGAMGGMGDLGSGLFAGDAVGGGMTGGGMTGGGMTGGGMTGGSMGPTFGHGRGNTPGKAALDPGAGMGLGGDSRLMTGGDWFSASVSWTDKQSSAGGGSIVGSETYETSDSIMTITTKHEGGVTRQTVTLVDKKTGDVTSETSTSGTGSKDESGSNDNSGNDNSGNDSSGNDSSGKDSSGKDSSGNDNDNSGSDSSGNDSGTDADQQGGSGDEKAAPSADDSTETTGMPNPNEGGTGATAGMVLATGIGNATHGMGSLTQPASPDGGMRGIGKASKEDLQEAASLEGQVGPTVTPGQGGFSLSGGAAVGPVDGSGLGVLGQPTTQDDDFGTIGAVQGTPDGRGSGGNETRSGS